MSERLDQEIRSAVIELVETSPPPHPIEQVLSSFSSRPSPLSFRSGLVRMAAVAAAVLVVGLGGAWIGRNLVPSDVSDVSVVEGELGPEPQFDPGSMGAEEEATLLPPGGELQPDPPEVSPGVPEGDVVAVGGIPGTGLEVFTWESRGGEKCLQIVGENSRDSRCIDGPLSWGTVTYDNPLPETDFSDPPGMFWTTQTGSEATDVVLAWPVPDDTSVVIFGPNENPLWQRPRGGVMAYAFDADTPKVGFTAYSADRKRHIATVFLPRQATDPVEPGATELQGSPEDIVAMGDPHPIARMWADSEATPEEFMQEAQDRSDIRSGGCSSGVPPEHRFCLLADDSALFVVPVTGETGLTVRISDPGFVRDVVIPLDGNEPVGVRTTPGPEVDMRIEYLGEDIGGLEVDTWFNDP